MHFVCSTADTPAVVLEYSLQRFWFVVSAIYFCFCEEHNVGFHVIDDDVEG